MEILTVGAAPATQTGAALVLLLLVIAIVLAMGAMRTAFALFWSLIAELAGGLWASVKAMLLLAFALVCVVFLALGAGGTSGAQSVDTTPSVGGGGQPEVPGPR